MASIVKAGILKEALTQAYKSKHRYKVGAVIFKGSKIFSSGHNSVGYSRLLHPKFRRYINSLCAEKCAIINAKKDLMGCSILVVRITPADNLSMAKPCSTCMKYLDYVGIKNIYYTDHTGKITKME
jgi:deoxycytidylate deaminase